MTTEVDAYRNVLRKKRDDTTAQETQTLSSSSGSLHVKGYGNGNDTTIVIFRSCYCHAKKVITKKHADVYEEKITRKMKLLH